MVSTTITKEEAFSAIEQLYAKGEHPTHLKLRAQLGRGSGPTLSAMLDEWARTRGPSVANAAAADVMSQPLAEAEKRLRNAAEEAAKLVAEAETSRRAELKAWDEALSERAAVLDARESALEQAERRLQERESEQAHLIAELKADKRALTEQLQAAGAAQAAAADDARVERQRLIDDRLVAQQQREVLTSRLEEATRQSAADRADIARLSARLLELEQLSNALRGERDLANEDRRRTSSELMEQLATALDTAGQLRQELADAQHRLQVASTELASTRAQFHEVTAERDRLLARAGDEEASRIQDLTEVVQRLARLHAQQETFNAAHTTSLQEIQERSRSLLDSLQHVATLPPQPAQRPPA